MASIVCANIPWQHSDMWFSPKASSPTSKHKIMCLHTRQLQELVSQLCACMRTQLPVQLMTVYSMHRRNQVDGLLLEMLGKPNQPVLLMLLFTGGQVSSRRSIDTQQMQRVAGTCLFEFKARHSLMKELAWSDKPIVAPCPW